MLEVHLLKTEKELKSLCKQELQILFTEMGLIKLVFNMIWKKVGLNGYVYDFSADYDAIVVDDILDIHNYLTKKMT